MNKASTQPKPNVMGRARGPRGFGGPVVKAKDRKGTIKRIWRYMEKQKVAMIAVGYFCYYIYIVELTRTVYDRTHY